MCEVRVDNIKVTNSKLKGRYINKNVKGEAVESLEEIQETITLVNYLLGFSFVYKL